MLFPAFLRCSKNQEGVASSRPFQIQQPIMKLNFASLSEKTESGSIPSGQYREIQFILSADFVGTILGDSIDSAASGIRVVGPWVAEAGKKLSGIEYTISAGSMKVLGTS